MEYTRKVPAMPGSTAGGGTAGEERAMAFATVTVSEGGGGAGEEERVNNVAELLLVRGLAQVIKHRGDEERSGEEEWGGGGWVAVGG